MTKLSQATTDRSHYSLCSIDYDVNLILSDNNLKKKTSLEHKNYVKYLGILVGSNLSWRYYIDFISSKISQGVGIISRLRHFLPTSTLFIIYRSLIEPYISYGLAAWGQATASHLNKILLLQKRALRLMYFSDSRTHAIPLFVSSSLLSLIMLYFKHIATLMHDIFSHCAPPKISELFTRSDQIHSHYTRFSASRNFHVQLSRLNQQLLSFSRIGTRIWNKIPPQLRELRKTLFKRKLHELLLKVLETEEVYVDINAVTRINLMSLLS